MSRYGFEDCADVCGHFAVEPRRRLVEENHRRVCDELDGDREPLQVAKVVLKQSFLGLKVLKQSFLGLKVLKQSFVGLKVLKQSFLGLKVLKQSFVGQSST